MFPSQVMKYHWGLIVARVVKWTTNKTMFLTVSEKIFYICLWNMNNCLGCKLFAKLSQTKTKINIWKSINFLRNNANTFHFASTKNAWRKIVLFY